MCKILLVNGSPNRDGNTAAALKLVEAAIRKKGVETQWFQLSAGPAAAASAARSVKVPIAVFLWMTRQMN